MTFSDDPLYLYSVMVNEEKTERVYDPLSEYNEIRREVIDWVRDMANQLQIAKKTLHIAIMCIDRLMICKDVRKIYLIALVCLMIAAKYNELERNLPSVYDYLRVSAGTLHCIGDEELKEWEIKVLEMLEWNITTTTSLDFAEVLLMVEDNNTTSLKSHTMKFLDLALEGMLLV